MVVLISACRRILFLGMWTNIKCFIILCRKFLGNRWRKSCTVQRGLGFWLSPRLSPKTSGLTAKAQHPCIQLRWNIITSGWFSYYMCDCKLHISWSNTTLYGMGSEGLVGLSNTARTWTKNGCTFSSRIWRTLRRQLWSQRRDMMRYCLYVAIYTVCITVFCNTCWF